MSPRRFLLALLTFVAALLLPAQASARLLPAPDTLPVAESPAAQPQWTVWGAEQYALADDGASVWIGGVGGVTQWDKQAGAYRRYSMLDGLPQTKVLAIAVDAAGNRWFGGIGGLSRLDKDDNWTHHTTANSGLRRNDIDALAVVGGDTLYAWHRTSDGSVSRLSPDGTWQWFPNRETVVEADYAAIAGRGSAVNALWTVAGAEVWTGKWAFDGAIWRDCSLPASYEIAGLVADGQNHVWAWTGQADTYEWDGQAWAQHAVPHVFSRHITALAVDQNGKVWAGLTEITNPYAPEGATVREATGENGHSLSQFGPVTALLSTAEGLWAVGPGWLMTPDFGTRVFSDLPRLQDVRDALADQSGALWLTSSPRPDTWAGALQALDDRGTLPLADDAWRDIFSPQQYCGRVTAFERLASDLWYATDCYSRLQLPPGLTRYRHSVRIENKLPNAVLGEITHLFAQDERRIWMAVINRIYNARDTIASFDDGGTPTDASDDQWQLIEIELPSDHVTVAVDAQGRLWRGEEDGLYRYDGAAWQQVYDMLAVCDIVPAADGTVFAQTEYSSGAGCAAYSDRLIVVRPDDAIEYHNTGWLLAYPEDSARARAVNRRNSMWTASVDGATWYIERGYPDSLWRLPVHGAPVSYALPVAAASVQRLEVDARGHVWLVADGKLWRMEGPVIHRLFLPTLDR